MSMRIRLSCYLLLMAIFCPNDRTCSHLAHATDRNTDRSHPQRIVHTHEMWRTGDDDSGVIFGVIVGIADDNDGRVHVLDGQLSTIHTFGPDGEHLTTLNREGEGPGECRRPSDICMLGADRFALAQPFPGRVITLDRHGVPTGDAHYEPLGGNACDFMVLRWLRAADDLLVLGGFCMGAGKGSDTQMHFISRCTPDGRELGRYLER